MAKSKRAGTTAKSSTGVTFSVVNSLPTTADAMAVAIFEKTSDVPAHLGAINKATGGALARVLTTGDFKAKAGSATSVPLDGGVKRLVVVGLGLREKFDLDVIRWAAGTVGKMAKSSKMAKVVLCIDGDLPAGQDANAVGQAIAEGAVMSQFSYNEFKKADETGATPGIAFTVHAQDNAKAFEAGLLAGKIIGEATNYTRLISCKPANVINPKTLAEEAKLLAAANGLKLTVIDAKKAEALGMGGLVAVGRGSNFPANLILLEYAGGKAKVAPIAVVGKAVTFDSGGISIKPGAGMEAMKYDKCGGMAVLGVMQAIAQLKLPMNVIGVIPAAENSISDEAYRPGDILRFYNGKTSEITNTDAEGRLILADALAYVSDKYKPSTIVDIATLTGGVVMALGGVYAGLFANDDALAADFETAGKTSGELLWRLPMHDRYKPMMDGYHADLINSAGREAHPVQGAIFLQHFVPEKTPWAHLDIAGVAFPSKDDRYMSKGASGFGVRVVTEFLRKRAGN